MVTFHNSYPASVVVHGVSSPPAWVIKLIWPIHTDTTMKSHDDMCQAHMNSNNDMILLPAMTAGTRENIKGANSRAYMVYIFQN